MRFRLWRSKTFWLGLPGLVFLLWGWWHSMGHFASVVLERHGGIFGFRHVGGAVVFVWSANMFPAPGELRYVNDRMTWGKALQFKDWLKMLSDDPQQMVRMVFIPYPYLILGYLAVWGGVLGWRCRRYRTAAEI